MLSTDRVIVETPDCKWMLATGITDSDEAT